MAEYTAYAEVLTPDHLQYKAYAAGIKKNPPGVLLQDILEETGGAYRYEMYLSEEFRADLLEVARLTSDTALARVAALPKAPISLEHLRHLDPRTTRIVLGHRLNLTEEESRRLGVRHEGPHDPRDTIYVES
jgi:hypothetical protein